MNTNTKNWMMECEAREWLQRYKAKRREHGVHYANDWWRKTVEDMQKKRGVESVDKLRKLMREYGRNENSGKS